MNENRLPNIIFAWMLNLNFIIIFYIASIMTVSLLGYVHENTALEFLRQIDSVTMPPWKISVLSILLYGSLVLFLCVKTEK